MNKKSIIFTIIISLAPAFLLFSCTGSEDVQPQISNNPPVVNNSNPADLARFSSAKAMETLLRQGMQQQPQAMLKAMPVMMAAAINSTASPAVSATNVQEVGVDEADIIKTDGQYIYVAEQQRPRLRIMQAATTAQASQSNEIGSFTLPADIYTQIDGLYHLAANANGGDLLTIIAGRMQQYYANLWFNPWSWQQQHTNILLLDIQNKTAPQLANRLRIDGALISSRRIADTLYLVTRHTPYFAEPNIAQPTLANAATNITTLQKSRKTLINGLTLNEMLPQVSINNAAPKPLLNFSDCYQARHDAKAVPEATIISITSIPLRNPSAMKSQCIIGNSETLYMSTKALYLATTRYEYQANASGSAFISYPLHMDTDIHKFTLTATGMVNYRHSATVDGHLGWEQDKKSFRMGEFNNDLRIATSVGQGWNNAATHHINVLRDSANSMQIIASLPNAQRPKAIGKVGERLYAARFVGERAYLVTFRVIDPLYVVDLSNPFDPYIAGELNIPGYSDYLHPVTPTLLLGLGKDAIADPAPLGTGDGRGSWYQGVKISLFDVSNPAAPAQVATQIIGKRGTQSDALFNHHAVTWLPASGARPARLAIPIQLHDTIPNNNITRFDTTQPNAYYNWTSTGIYMFDILSGSKTQPAKLQQRAILPLAQASAANPWPQGMGNNRAVIIGEHIHALHKDKVYSGVWGTNQLTIAQ
ncbi:MAG: beta-propeller domain-containing protein [Mariprofundales bacterium]